MLKSVSIYQKPITRNINLKTQFTIVSKMFRHKKGCVRTLHQKLFETQNKTRTH